MEKKMLLKKITLTNFGIYKGEHTIELQTSAKKPVILFGAYNGSGKTTILDSLQLVLYGKAAQTSNRGKIPYEDYLRSLINRDVNPKQGAGISLIFTSKRNGKIEEIEVMRSWYQTGLSIKENCEVKRDGIFDTVTSERWHEFVEEFMPAEIAELFFFDGEKIESLADPYKSASILRSGIYSLLGINTIDSLIKSLHQIEKRKSLENIDDIDKSVLAREQAEIDQLKINEKGGIKKKKDEYEEKLKMLQLEKKEINEQMRISGIDLLQRRPEFQAKLLILNEKKKILLNQLQQIVAGKAPLLILKDEIKNLKNEIQKNNGFTSKTLPLFIREKDELIDNLIKSKIDNSALSLVKSYLEKRISKIDANLGIYSNLDISETSLPSVDEMDEIQNHSLKLINEIDKLNEEIDSINRMLQAVPNDEKIRHYFDEQKRIDDEIIKIETLKIDALQKLSEVEAKIKTLENNIQVTIDKLSKQRNSSNVNKRIVKHSTLARSTLEQFKNKLIDNNLERLGNEISNCFRLLHRKNKFILNFQINKDDFSIKIKNDNLQLIEAKSLSAGERQLLSVSILWALAKCSGKKLPTLIDTPLGRLDGPHREKIVNNYFPNASDQVLIFSTDSEITNNYYQLLKNHISKEYSINYDEESKSSVIINGYFNNEVRI